MNPALGFFGGTFDPIHNGHLRSAYEVHQRLGLAQTFLLPNAIPPHKTGPDVSPEQRLAMVELAAADHVELRVDARELQRDAPSYTVDTLTELRAEHPDTPLCFIIGMDSLLSLPRWHQPERILELAHLVVCHRPGYQLASDAPVQPWLARYGCDDPAQLHSQPAGLIHCLAVTQLEIASSTLRQQMAEGYAPHFLLPDPVVRYIEQHDLYGINLGGKGPKSV
ncbi:nicotinate-nucleotide adenylyltransferase [Ferrimonas balearica]|uniref:nicotinate-nucleotide adenylyltransferase n=1 Tax=Ferrimonas balearica TaxID=44012 RepID=UPI001C9888FE|nr:nicotinate-nucleotide adenylyltransferase [Ferrimonas balearica]MBY6224852.1 nicotinate-nucleotide adenylyltransferase [Ferrimonas balearica]